MYIVVAAYYITYIISLIICYAKFSTLFIVNTKFYLFQRLGFSTCHPQINSRIFYLLFVWHYVMKMVIFVNQDYD